MATSKALTVDAYLAELPPERRAVVSQVRDMIRRHIPAGYTEEMAWGVIAYDIPLARYPHTYNGQPLSYVALAAQKNHYALYLMGSYQASDQARIHDAFAKAGKKLDMGKACVRFKKVDDLPLDALGEIIAGVLPDEFIARYEATRAAPRTR
jgi:uncharacterized protein YdhG (YjbR/CyaY superfamily)